MRKGMQAFYRIRVSNMDSIELGREMEALQKTPTVPGSDADYDRSRKLMICTDRLEELENG